MRRITRHCLLLCVLAVPFIQAQETRWQNLAAVAPGTKIQVVENSLKSTVGKFVGCSESDITFRGESGEVVLARAQVYRVTLIGGKRKRNALIGLGVGAGVGVGLGAAANRVVGDARVVAGMAGAFGAVGAGIGILIPGTKTVYRAEMPKETARSTGPRGQP